jgi:hypothetical protein
MRDWMLACMDEDVETFSFDEWLAQQPTDYVYSEIINACEAQDYQRRWGADARWKAIMDGNELYWNDLVAAGKKQIITLEEYEAVNGIVNSFRSNPYIDHLISPGSDIAHSAVLHVFFQVPIYFDSYGGNLKGLVDMLVIDIRHKG